MILALLHAALNAACAFEPPYDPVIFPPEVYEGDALDGGEIRTSAGGALVLRHTDIVAEVHAGVARITMVQHFQNPYDEALEAEYLLPLPDDAAVDHMELQVGERVTEAWIMERDAARATYEQAVADGKRAALLEQERENLFRQSVAGICPDENVTVTVQYVHQVDYEDGLYTLALPTTSGPRYDAPWVDPADAAAVDTPYASGTGRTVSVAVYLDEGMPVEALFSDTHDVDLVAEGTWGAEIRLLDDAPPDRDFVLTWSLAGTAPRAAVVAHRPDPDEPGYVALTLEPQVLGDLFVPRPRELMFVIDESCSMRGEPFAAARATVIRALDEMNSTDTFNLVKFSSASTSLFARPQPATPATRRAAEAWLASFEGGSTNMDAGIIHSLKAPGNPDALRLVLMLTDGYVSGDRPMFEVVRENLGESRLFALGVGSSVNRFLLEGLAEMGRGDVAYHMPGRTPIAETVDTFYGRIAHPAMSDVEIDWGSLDVVDVYPKHIPDLWAGQPLRVVARYAQGGTDQVVVHGIVGTAAIALPLQVTLPEVAAEHEGLASLWARRRIRDVEWYPGDRTPDEVRDEVTQVALDHHLVSTYTSLVAVDDAPCPCGKVARTEDVPHEAPYGVDAGVLGALGSHGYGAGGGSGHGYGYGSGVGGLLGAKGTQIGSGGIAVRGSALGGGDGTAAGLGGLGTKGTGSGASAYGNGYGNFGAKADGTVQTVAADPVVLGALDKSLIDAVVKRHLNQIKYCYQRELNKDPNLAGRVSVKFVIAADGTVPTSQVAKSTLGNAAVEQCVAGRFARMQFPQPKGGGVVIVTYPFQFNVN